MAAILLTLALPAQATKLVYSTPGTYSFTVPDGANSISFTLQGGGGGGGSDASNVGGIGGDGQLVVGTLLVTPGTVYTLMIGGAGNAGASGQTGSGGGAGGSSPWGAGGRGGNAGGSGSSGAGGGGGGATALLLGSTVLAVAAGGGGTGGSLGHSRADGQAGGVGTQTSSGTAGTNGVNFSGDGGGGGGGGGGYAGGNGGFGVADNASAFPGGGAGGSGYGSGLLGAVFSTVVWTGGPAGGAGSNGQITLTFHGSCLPPPNTPSGLTLNCVCDVFARPSLNPSTIFGENWAVSNADGLGNPYINPSTGLLRLTENSTSNAKMAVVPALFPAAGNYFSVEFNHYAYNGTGADGLAVILSDASITPAAGSAGGGLAYRLGAYGFAGGWLGVGLDEYGNYQNGGGGPGFIAQSVGAFGPGNVSNGYRWIAGTGGGQGIDNRGSTSPAPGYKYQVVVDSRNVASGTVNVTINRDTTTKIGNAYSTLLGPFNAYPTAQAAVTSGWIAKVVPDYFKISFTASTGAATNIHEIDGLRICAQSILPPSGGIASGFAAIDDAYASSPKTPSYTDFQSGHIYMKLVATPFPLWIGALTTSPAPGLSTGYSAVSAKYVQVKLVDNSDGVCGTNGARTCSSACVAKTAVESGSGATQVATFAQSATTGVASPSPQFSLAAAYKHLVAVMRECTTSACTAFTSTPAACSVDAFSVRPHAMAATTTANASTRTGTPLFRAGADTFKLDVSAASYPLTGGVPQALTTVPSYTGIPKVGTVDTSAMGAGNWVAGSLSVGSALANAVAGVSTNTPTYDEVGVFRLAGYWPSAVGNASSSDGSPRGIYDGVQVSRECVGLSTAQCDMLKLGGTWTGIDSVSTANDCLQDSFSNLKTSGQYGCSFGLVSDQVFGRFVPDHFDTVVTPACVNSLSPLTNFTYAGQPFTVQVTAKTAGGSTTKNYDGNTATPSNPYSRAVTLSAWDKATGTSANPGPGILSLAQLPETVTGTAPSATLATADFVVGVALKNTPVYTFGTTVASPYAFAKQRQTAPTDIRIRATDTDNVSSRRVSPAVTVEGATGVRSGRLRLTNAYGSELLDLPLPIALQYWSGASGWQKNAADNCTAIHASDFAFYGYNLVMECGTAINLTGVAPNYTAKLAPPGWGKSGWTDVTLNLGASPAGKQCVAIGSIGADATTANAPWLQYNWRGTIDNPKARATFGVYRSGPLIYRREIF